MMESSFLKPQKRKFFFQNLSLQKRIPLLVCILLATVVSVFILVSYISLRNLELKASKQRLIILTSDVSNMLAESIQDVISNTQKIASSESIISYLRSPGKGEKNQALEVLQHIGTDGSSMFAELLDSNFNILLSSGKPAYGSLIYSGSSRNFPGFSDSLKAGNIYNIKDSIFYPVTVAVKDNNKIYGYVTRYRYVKITYKMLEQFSRIAGRGAALYVGNRDQSLWTNLFHPVVYHYPAERLKEGKSFENIQQDKQKVIGAMHSINGTPWLVVLEFPLNAVLQGSTQFLVWLIILGTTLILIGILSAWFMSRNLTRPLNRLKAAVGNFAVGNYTGEVAVHSGDEVGELAGSFNVMVAKLQAARTAMEQKIIESEQLATQLRNLSAHLQNVREEERKGIAREMHDELGQLLTAFKMDVYFLKKRLPDNLDAALKEKLQSMENSIDDSVKFVRRLSSELRDGPLEDLGLVATLEWYCREFTKRFGIPVTFHTSLENLPVSLVVSTGLYRICQESLTNIARHSGASSAAVTLVREKELVILSIQDNGKGFEADSPGKRKTLGLIGMNERAIMISGKLTLRSTPGSGTTIQISVPFTGETLRI